MKAPKISHTIPRRPKALGQLVKGDKTFASLALTLTLTLVLSSILSLSSCGTPQVQNSPDPSATSAQSTETEALLQLSSDDPWISHYIKDILPFWNTDLAKGSPVGNFPTFLNDAGTAMTKSERFPRMLSRQIYQYAMGYHMTGEPSLLAAAKAGVDWLLAHGRDPVNGGWLVRLDRDGKPLGNDDKTAQNTAYAMMGPGAYYYITRDPAVEASILETRDLVFSPTGYWDSKAGAVIDSRDYTMKTVVDVLAPGIELVAQLDQINAYMLLVQPILSTQERRDQFLGDLKTLVEAMKKHLLRDGIFWGATGIIGDYTDPPNGHYPNHNDFGHTMKAWWMVHQIDKRLPNRPYDAMVQEQVHRWLDLAWDEANSQWTQAPTSQTTASQNGVWWWVYAELDQLAATLNLADGRYDGILAASAASWMEHFVDPVNHEVYSEISATGRRQNGNKANEWKNGYHSTEHALVRYLLDNSQDGKPVTLYFAVPAADAQTFTAVPYFYQGTEVSRVVLDPIPGMDLVGVKVSFTNLK